MGDPRSHSAWRADGTPPPACLTRPSPEKPFTWSCLSAFWACSGFLYSTKPNPMDSSAPGRERQESRCVAGGEEHEEGAQGQVQGPLALGFASSSSHPLHSP